MPESPRPCWLHRRAVVCLGLSLGLAAASGCGGRELDTVPVRGQVTIGGSPPPREGTIYFAALEPAPGKPLKSGRATFAADGRYEAMTLEEGDGLVPGTYRVNVECFTRPPQNPNEIVPLNLGHGFEAEFVVPADASDALEKNFDLPPRRAE